MSFLKNKWSCSDAAALRNELRYGAGQAPVREDHTADALAYAMMSPDEALLNYQRRQAIVEAHPDWTEDQVSAHYELTRPTPLIGTRGTG